MTEFSDRDLRGSVFRNVDLRGARFRAVDLSGADLRGVDLTGAVLRGAELVDVDISGEIENVRVNGVDIGPLVTAELDRRDPDRVKMRPRDPAGFGQAWDIIERLWDDTVARASDLPPDLLHESVDGEWSFTEALRHLVFATDAWVRRQILGDPSPWDPLDLPWDEMPDTPGVPRDRAARPSLDAVLALRRDRMGTVREVIAGLTEANLERLTRPAQGPGWPHSHGYPVRECLLVILNEEWEHRRFAERDLDALTGRAGLSRATGGRAGQSCAVSGRDGPAVTVRWKLGSSAAPSLPCTPSTHPRCRSPAAIGRMRPGESPNASSVIDH